MWDQSFKLKKKVAIFFLKTSLIRLGRSPDIIKKISWSLKEAILEAKAFVLNLDKFESKLQGPLDSRDLNFHPICKCHTILETSWCPYEALHNFIEIRTH